MKIERRLFLGTMSILAAGYAFRHYGLESEQSRNQLPIRFYFGNHVIDNRAFKEIMSGNNIVVGESTHPQLLRTLYPYTDFTHQDIPLWKQIAQFSPNGYGNTKQIQELEKENLDSLRKFKRCMVACDGRIIQQTSPDQYLIPITDALQKSQESRTYTLAATCLSPLGVSALAELANRLNITKLNSTEILDQLLMIEFSLLGTIVSSYISTHIPKESSIAQRMIEKAGIDLDAWFYTFASVIPELKAIHQGFITTANLSMVINTKLTRLYLLSQKNLYQVVQSENSDPATKDKPLSMLFFAGGGHVDSQELYRLSYEQLKSQLDTTFAELFSYSYQKILQAQTPEEKKSELEKWSIFTMRIGYPIAGYMQYPEYVYGNQLHIPDSPRLIIYRYLQQYAANHPDDFIAQTMTTTLIENDKKSGYNASYDSELKKYFSQRIARYGYDGVITVYGNTINTFEGNPFFTP